MKSHELHGVVVRRGRPKGDRKISAVTTLAATVKTKQNTRRPITTDCIMRGCINAVLKLLRWGVSKGICIQRLREWYPTVPYEVRLAIVTSVDVTLRIQSAALRWKPPSWQIRVPLHGVIKETSTTHTVTDQLFLEMMMKLAEQERVTTDEERVLRGR